jgi:hypothetical protein
MVFLLVCLCVLERRGLLLKMPPYAGLRFISACLEFADDPTDLLFRLTSRQVSFLILFVSQFVFSMRAIMPEIVW